MYNNIRGLVSAVILAQNTSIVSESNQCLTSVKSFRNIVEEIAALDGSGNSSSAEGDQIASGADAASGDSDGDIGSADVESGPSPEAISSESDSQAL